MPTSYDSYGTFYEATYPEALEEMRVAGRPRAAMLKVAQSRGDWSEAATPDLVIALLHRHPVAVTMDLGAGRFRVRCTPGMFVVTPPRVATTIVADGQHDLYQLALPYKALWAFAGGDEAGLPRDGDFGPLHAEPQSNTAVRTALLRIWDEMRAGNAYGPLATEGLLLQLTAALLRSRGGPLTRGVLAPWQVRRATEFMAAHLDTPVSLADIASSVQLSAYHFCRAFKATTGQTPAQWLAVRRMERAQVLMLDPGYPLLQVALAVGYASAGAFATAFKRVTGLTPATWRRTYMR